ncbi:hypothetical protein SAMN04488089_109163 [Myroides profundi]|uniref:Uncharacterized protein n=1 Tax=Myroides profundi TaxID=480520 RepID=A0AAJ5BEH5_MYRPR|nr:hypothetical protein SAMN04488089_109163 [Myroides profundi]
MIQGEFNKRVNKNSPVKLFFFLLTVFLLLCIPFYKEMLLDTSFNFFPLVANIILVSLLPLFTYSLVKREAYKLIVIGIVFLVVNLVEHHFNLLEISLFNLYCVMYILFFYCYAKKITIENRFQKGYTCFINYFLIFYVVLLNVGIVFDKFYHSIHAEQIMYFNIGIKLIILFISMLTLCSYVIVVLVKSSRVLREDTVIQLKEYLNFK